MPKRSFNKPHPRSLLARCAGDPELRAKYNEWINEARDYEAAMRRWGRQDCLSIPGRELQALRSR